MQTLTLAIDELDQLIPIQEKLSSRKINSYTGTFEQNVCENFAIKKNPDYPVAAILAEEYIENDNHFFLATPCFFSLQRDYYRFEKSFVHELDEADLTWLCHHLNHFFSNNDIKFILKNNSLLLKTSVKTKVQTFFPEELNTVEARDFLPFGEDSMYWHTLINEIQMWLFSCELNQKRKEKNLLPINTIWFSGGGSFPKDIQLNDSLMCVTNASLVDCIYKLKQNKNLVLFNKSTSLSNFSNINFYYDFRGELINKHDAFNSFVKYFNSNKFNKHDLLVIFKNIIFDCRPDRLSGIKFWKNNKSIYELFHYH